MTGYVRTALDNATEVITEVFLSIHEAIAVQLKSIGARRRARIEAELDRKQDELRATVLQLAEALGADAHEARKALIRESYRASGRAPSQAD